MEIMQVRDDLVSTRCVDGLRSISLRVLSDFKGKLCIACDPVGVPIGQWVITVSGSAARHAMPSYDTMTDLTIAGIIDDWEEWVEK